VLFFGGLVWPGEEEECECCAGCGEGGDDEEGGLEAFGEGDEAVGTGVRGEVVVGAGDGDGGDDRDAEGGADLEGGVAEAGGEPRLAFGDAGEGGDRGGDEGEADAGAAGADQRLIRPGEPTGAARRA
jgi:hypothetical protein